MAGTGGKRAGSGRKPSKLKTILKKLPKQSAAVILATINAEKRLINLANSEDESIALKTVIFLWEQAHGKAKQRLEHAGGDGEPIKHSIGIEFIDPHAK